MSGDKIFYDKAIEIVDLLQGAFHTSRNRLKLNIQYIIYCIMYDMNQKQILLTKRQLVSCLIHA